MTLSIGQKIGLAGVVVTILIMTGGIGYFLFFQLEIKNILFSLELIFFFMWILFLLILFLFFAMPTKTGGKRK